MLANLLFQIIDCVVLLGALYVLIGRLGAFGRSARFTEEIVTRLWRESARVGGEESGPAPNRPSCTALGRRALLGTMPAPSEQL